MLPGMERNRLLLVAAATGVAALVAVVLILAIGGGGGSSTTTSTAAGTQPGTAQPLGTGIPQNGDTLGKPGAPTSLVVYEDPQCPYCRQWNTDALGSVVSQFVRTGRIKLVYRGVVIVGPDSVRGLRAIYAAGEQNRLWNMVDALYARQGPENSGWISDKTILAAAREAGADGQKILAAMGSASVTAALREAQAHAKADQLRGTPTFMIEQPPARSRQLSVSALDATSFVASLDAALQG